MPNCNSCGTTITPPHTTCKTVNPCDPVQPPPAQLLCVECVVCKPKPICIPECRKSFKDACKVKPLPACSCEPCPPKNCVKKTKCKFYSVKDACRQNKPCPPTKVCGGCKTGCGFY